MNNPFLNNFQLRLWYIAIWVTIIFAQIAVTTYYFETTNENIILLRIFDSVICNILQAACILGLWHPIRYYGNIKNLPLFLLFHLTLLLISGITWMGLGYSITQYVVLQNNISYTPYFIILLPGRITVGILIYAIFVLAYYLLLSRSELKARKIAVEEKSVASSTTPVEKLSRVIVKKKSEFHCILVNQILYIEANGDYVTIYTDSARYLKDQTMKYWETHLPDDCFVRIHRSFIVNIEVIAKIEVYEKETYKVHLKNGDIIKASISGYKLLKQKMQL